ERRAEARVEHVGHGEREVRPREAEQTPAGALRDERTRPDRRQHERGHGRGGARGPGRRGAAPTPAQRACREAGPRGEQDGGRERERHRERGGERPARQEEAHDRARPGERPGRAARRRDDPGAEQPQAEREDDDGPDRDEQPDERLARGAHARAPRSDVGAGETSRTSRRTSSTTPRATGRRASRTRLPTSAAPPSTRRRVRANPGEVSKTRNSVIPGCGSHRSSGSRGRRRSGRRVEEPATTSSKSARDRSRDDAEAAENGLASDPGRIATETNSAPNAWNGANASTDAAHTPRSRSVSEPPAASTGADRSACSRCTSR